MKKTKAILALLMAAVMVLAAVPVGAVAPNDASAPMADRHTPVNFYVTDLDYSTVTSVANGGSGYATPQSNSYFYLGISEHSSMGACAVIIDYPEEYVSITAQTSTWSGSIITLINELWDEEPADAESDKFYSVAETSYVGGSGAYPHGEPGNLYINGGCYLGSGLFDGVQMGGNYHRFKLRLDKTPPINQCMYDDNGFYLPISMYLYEYITYSSSTNQFSDNYCSDGYDNNGNWYCEHESWLSTTDGKIYIDKTTPPPTNECTDYHSWEYDVESTDWICEICGKHQEISPVLGYQFGRDNFSFSNSGIKSYSISMLGSYYVSPKIKVDILSLMAHGLARFTHYIDYGTTFSGACFGMATMDASFFSGMSTEDFGADETYQLSVEHADDLIPNKDTKLKDAINIMFLSQTNPETLFFQWVQDGVLSGNNFESIVNKARQLKEGDYPTAVTFTFIYHNNKKAGHAVNIIGIEPDDFWEDYYCITVYDNNTPNHVGCIAVEKNFKSAKFGFWCQEHNCYENFKIEGINYFIESSLYSIDYWAPGLRTSPYYGSNSIYEQPSAESYISSEDNNALSPNDDAESLITFIVPEDNFVEIFTPSGVTFSSDGNGNYSTNIDDAFVVPFIGTTLNRVILPYENGEYRLSCDEQLFVNINNNHNAATIFAEEGCDIVYSADGRLSYTPKTENEYVEAAYYRYDIWADSDAIGIEICGNVSSTMSLCCDGNTINVLGADVAEQTYSIQHNDYEMTNQELPIELDDNVTGLIISNSDDGIIAMPGNGIIHGDADGNGLVNANDALMVLRFALGLISGVDTAAADVDGNGVVNANDALMILRAALGIITL